MGSHYNPDQPRQPSGSNIGGEWRSGGGVPSASERAKLEEQDKKDFKKLGNNIMPAGSKGGENSFSWTKRGGHAGREQLNRVYAKAKAAGFGPAGQVMTGNPDGSHMGSSATWHHPKGHTLVTSSSYGVTQHDNYFSADLKRGRASSGPAVGIAADPFYSQNAKRRVGRMGG